MSKPRLLDLFCGAGGAAMGYHRAGFEVVGVDINPQPHYPFEFHQGDAMEVLAGAGEWYRGWMEMFDAIHVSPPCQAYLNLRQVNRALDRVDNHQDLIAKTREGLLRAGRPYVIENGQDARLQLRGPIRLCGSSFGLGVRRHRLFETNFGMPLAPPPCAHHLEGEPRYWTSWRPNGEHRLSRVAQVYGNGGRAEEWAEAMGIDWMTKAELREAVPPAYTEWMGRELLTALDVGRSLRPWSAA